MFIDIYYSVFHKIHRTLYIMSTMHSAKNNVCQMHMKNKNRCTLFWMLLTMIKVLYTSSDVYFVRWSRQKEVKDRLF